MSSTLDYWPPIQEAIASNSDPLQQNSAAKVQCPICMDNIAVTSFPPVAPREGDHPDIDPTQGEVLLCGHVLCQACRSHDEATRYHERKCPMCRADLRCTDCGRPAKTMSIPKEGPSSTVPALAKGDDGARCADCNSKRWFRDMIQQGEWPNGLADLEPGFVPFFYHVVGRLEDAKRDVTQETLIQTFSTIVKEEFSTMTRKRAEAIYNRSVTTGNPWFHNEPAVEMNKRAAPPPTEDIAEVERRRKNVQALIYDWTDELVALGHLMEDENLPQEEGIRIMRRAHHLDGMMRHLAEERRKLSMLQDEYLEEALRTGRSGNRPAERRARVRALLFEEERAEAAIREMGDALGGFLEVYDRGLDLALVPLPDDPDAGPGMDIADMLRDDAMDMEANELPGRSRNYTYTRALSL
ncbi:uncharacterized protein B0J16DRAFT_336538 [Fusarium flagelliforme]|uniref:RING-type domain-containing protein n=1 Tax=Fusarium flagelliforme TaxID=2675880 RepID=A0A395MCJ7_9HYPO|nr:uncharacterized protein B0J16DRAFT_336538 [Fusarium flagelliforme]KAH7188163.1 hypothetical protein B0J16DRAFT_336538 [Fusarium flagelliforme]RFN44819.1 hypothetical protein FIE12Z_10920 [Fusarium flagelliforme]